MAYKYALSILICLFFLICPFRVSAGVITAGPTGLSGVTVVNANDEIVIYSVRIQKTFNPEGLTRIGITIEDLSSPTGIANTDFTALRLYRSADAVLGGGDVQIATVLTGAINIGIETNLDALQTIPGGPGGEFYFLITADISAGAVSGHAFKLSAQVNNIDLDQSAPVNNGDTDQTLNGVVISLDNNRIVIGFDPFSPNTTSHRQPIPVGWEWIAGLFFVIYGAYKLAIEQQRL